MIVSVPLTRNKVSSSPSAAKASVIEKNPFAVMPPERETLSEKSGELARKRPAVLMAAGAGL